VNCHCLHQLINKVRMSPLRRCKEVSDAHVCVPVSCEKQVEFLLCHFAQLELVFQTGQTQANASLRKLGHEATSHLKRSHAVTNLARYLFGCKQHLFWRHLSAHERTNNCCYDDACTHTLRPMRLIYCRRFRTELCTSSIAGATRSLGSCSKHSIVLGGVLEFATGAAPSPKAALCVILCATRIMVSSGYTSRSRAIVCAWAQLVTTFANR
jgi:hypothetical protein